MFWADMFLAPYLNGTIVGRGRFGNCYRPGSGAPANQSTYYPVFPQTDAARRIERITLQVGPQGFAGQDFLCSEVEYKVRESHVDQFRVRCLCRRNQCNLDLTSVGSMGPPPPGKDPDILIVDMHDHPNISAPTLTVKMIEPTANATRPDALDECGRHPDSEDCNPDGSSKQHSLATHNHRVQRLWLVWSMLAGLLSYRALRVQFSS
ncbi:uncharacterized protein LOC129598151 [Paramacrobiotus metropolitanus]|uniref:uncharacterized protein LOC129598151 n=1 Tax=Paramacrobiotus metropolitanus TaxID=2943436 RepID=UPI002445C24D|nr:uncharacterized protein LOC129598151 [Paramacrobiotus metropolitanus]XP_055351894.1 uncharacterized protein LOC129598151 [Paramacrobiotus metropolitanus]